MDPEFNTYWDEDIGGKYSKRKSKQISKHHSQQGDIKMNGDGGDNNNNYTMKSHESSSSFATSRTKDTLSPATSPDRPLSTSISTSSSPMPLTKSQKDDIEDSTSRLSRDAAATCTQPSIDAVITVSPRRGDGVSNYFLYLHSPHSATYFDSLIHFPSPRLSAPHIIILPTTTTTTFFFLFLLSFFLAFFFSFFFSCFLFFFLSFFLYFFISISRFVPLSIYLYIFLSFSVYFSPSLCLFPCAVYDFSTHEPASLYTILSYLNFLFVFFACLRPC